MHIRIPYTFKVVGVLPKKRSESTTLVGGYVNHEITEVDDLDAPIATQWTDGNGETFQTRWYEGSHWKIHKIYDEDKNYQLVSRQVLVDMISNAQTRHNPIIDISTSGAADDFLRGDLPEFAETDFRQITSTEQNSVLEKIKDKVDNCIIVDDQVWVKSGEPYYRYDRHKMANDTFSPVVELTPDDIHTIHWPHETFSAEQFDILVDYANGGYADVHVRDEMKIHVLVPESINFDADWISLIGTARDFVKGNERYLASNSTNFIRNWANIKDAAELAVTDPSDENKANLHALAKETITIQSEVLSERLNNAADRWNNRDISLDIDIEQRRI